MNREKVQVTVIATVPSGFSENYYDFFSFFFL